MSYPMLPQDKGNYPDSYKFPAIAEREAPVLEENNEMHGHLPPHGDGQKRDLEQIGEPKNLQFGITKVWLEGKGATPSVSFHEGTSGRAGSKGNGEFCYAPGSDDGDLYVCWEILNLHEVFSACLEVYCRGHDKPFLVKKWDVKSNFKSLHVQKGTAQGLTEGAKQLPLYVAKVKWTDIRDAGDVEFDKEAKLAGDETATFPDGVLTAARSPYQIRMTISAANEPRLSTAKAPNEDAIGFPLIAWTYAHVLVHSLELFPGVEDALPGERDDSDKFFDKERCGDKTYALEMGILGELQKTCGGLGRAFANDPDAFVNVLLDSGVFKPAHLPGTKKEVSLLKHDLAYQLYRSLWGDGPRIPIFARIRCKDLGGNAALTPKATRGLQILWDWDDFTPADHDHSVAPSPKVARWCDDATSRKQKDYLAAALNRYVKAEADRGDAPKGSDNAHVSIGGKRGKGANPVFLPQEGSQGDSVVKGSFPFAVKACEQRKWAAMSVARSVELGGPLKAQAGVLFQPSRMAGDCWRVSAYVVFPDDVDEGFWKKTGAELRESCETPHATTGIFEIGRRVRATVLRKGSKAPKPSAEVDKAFAPTGVKLDMEVKVVDQTAWNAAAKAGDDWVRENYREGWRQSKWPDYFDHVLDLESTSSYAFDFKKPEVIKREQAALHRRVHKLRLDKGSAPVPPFPNSVIKDQKGRTGKVLWAYTAQIKTSLFGDTTPYYQVLVPDMNGMQFGTRRNNEVTIQCRQGGEVKEYKLTVAKHSLKIGNNAREAIHKAIDNCYALSIDSLENVLKTILKSATLPHYVKNAHAGEERLFHFLFQHYHSCAHLQKFKETPLRVWTSAPVGGLWYPASAEPPEFPTRGFCLTAADEYAGFDFKKGILKKHLDKKGNVKPNSVLGNKCGDDIITHEFGHALFLGHALPEGHLSPHVEEKECVMNYDPDSTRFCALCILRLRGWSLFGKVDLEHNEDERLEDLSQETENASKSGTEITFDGIEVYLPAVGDRTIRIDKDLKPVSERTFISKSDEDPNAKNTIHLLYGSLAGDDAGIRLRLAGMDYEDDATKDVEFLWSVTNLTGAEKLDLTYADSTREAEFFPNSMGLHEIRVYLKDDEVDLFDEDYKQFVVYAHVHPLVPKSLKVTVPSSQPKTARKLIAKLKRGVYEAPAEVWELSNMDIKAGEDVSKSKLVLMSGAIHGDATPAERLLVKADVELGHHAHLCWSVSRYDGDSQAVIQLSPNPLPTFDVDENDRTKLTLCTDASGAFHVQAWATLDPNTETMDLPDHHEDALTANFVFPQARFVSNHHEIVGVHCGVSKHGNDVAMHSQDTDKEGFNFESNVPFHAKTKVLLVGGGEDGKLGLDWIGGGWVNNLLRDESSCEWKHKESGDTTEAKLMYIFKDYDDPQEALKELDPPLADKTPIVDSRGAAEPSRWFGPKPCLSMNKPLETSPITCLEKNQASARDAEPGIELVYESVDAPMTAWDGHMPITKDKRTSHDPDWPICKIDYFNKFCAFLCFWTHDPKKDENSALGRRLYAVLGKIQWTVQGAIDVDPEGTVSRYRQAFEVVSTVPPTPTLAQDVKKAGVELFPPGGLQTMRPRIMDGTDLGQKYPGA